MKKSAQTIFFVILLLSVIFFSVPVYSITINFPNPLGTTTLEGIVDASADLLFRIGVVMVPLLIIYAAFLIVTASGNPEQASRGRKIMVWTCIGFIFILLFRGLFDLVLGLLGV